MQCKFDILSWDNDDWYSLCACVCVCVGRRKKFKLDLHQWDYHQSMMEIWGWKGNIEDIKMKNSINDFIDEKKGKCLFPENF